MDVSKYRYDAENLKVALKCRYLHIDPRVYMNEKGNLSPQEVENAVKNNNFDGFAENLSKAANVASVFLQDSESARKCDLLIEQAAFMDVLIGRLKDEEIVCAVSCHTPKMQ